MSSYSESHYGFIERNGDEFSRRLNLRYSITILLRAHGDKGYGYRSKWEASKIPFNHGMCIYLMSYMREYEDKEVRYTANGFVNVADWVIEKYKTMNHVFDGMK